MLFYVVGSFFFCIFFSSFLGVRLKLVRRVGRNDDRGAKRTVSMREGTCRRVVVGYGAVHPHCPSSSKLSGSGSSGGNARAAAGTALMWRVVDREAGSVR